MRVIIALWMAVMVAGPSLPARALDRLDETPRIAVMSAFEPEWEALRSDLLDSTEHVVNGRTFLTGELAGQDVVLFLSGISMVNTAMTTQQAVDRFNLTAIVFSGIAGGVNPALSIGDVVVADQWGQYLEAVFARETEDGYSPPPFLDTPFPNYGMIFPRTVGVTRKGEIGEERLFWMQADARLLEVARRVAAAMELEDCANGDTCLSERPEVIVGGNGVSGQAFVDNADFRKYVFETFDAQVLDMESAAAAHVAFNNAMPFIAFRSLSDLAGGGEGENEMSTFFALASKNSAEVVKAFLRAMP